MDRNLHIERHKCVQIYFITPGQIGKYKYVLMYVILVLRYMCMLPYE